MDRLKILHTGDAHLGAKFVSLGARGREQRRKLVETFGKVIDLAINARVHLVLVAGDLFDANNPSPELINLVLRGFERLQKYGIEVCLVPGTHDRYTASSVYRRAEFSELAHVHIFTSEEMTPLQLSGLDTTVYGRALIDARPGDVLEGLKKSTASRWHICLVHGSLRVPGLVEEDDALIDIDSLQASGMDYVALGHWHSLADHSRWGIPAYYCGAPEPISLRDREAGFVILGEFPAGGPPDIKPIRVSRRRTGSLHLNMDEINDSQELRERIREQADENLMLEVVMRGLTRHDMVLDPLELEEELASLFFHLTVRDDSSVSLVELQRRPFPANTIMGRFMDLAEAKMRESEGEERKLAEDALKVGLSYLMRSDAR